ncbi:hypothetical protein LINGRAHAP2_LOCUS1749 [Linum grandiflorum]
MLLGHTADRYMPITAAELAAAYPHAYGELPPPIQILVGQRGLHAPRAPLLALLPAPPPPDRSPRYYSTFICTPP